MADLTEQADLSENDLAAVYNDIISSFKHDPPRPKKVSSNFFPNRLKVSTTAHKIGRWRQVPTWS